MGKGRVGLAVHKLALLPAHGDVRSLQPRSCQHELHHIFPTTKGCALSTGNQNTPPLSHPILSAMLQ